MSVKVQKILVCGDVEGKFNQLFKRVSNVHQKNGPFSLLLCVGEFFGADNSEWRAYRAGALKVPLPTYVLGPNNPQMKTNYPDMRGCELCENVIYLGPYGIYPCTSGLRIAYMSGLEEENSTATSFAFSSVKALETQVGKKPSIDILLTSQWPDTICKFSKAPERIDTHECGSPLISRLAYKLKPRYHFVGLHGIYFERLPYRNHKILKEAARPVTRFISLGKVGNPQKEKWLYAFNITPSSHAEPGEVNKQPDDVTECPYSEENIVREPQKKQDLQRSQFFYDMKSEHEESKGMKRKVEEGHSLKRKPPKPTGPCWFCLASPEVEKHLIVCVGNHAYVALAKGALVPEHLLILPITHFQSTPELDEDCREEIEKFKNALHDMFKKQGKCVVFFERNYRSQHLQVQVVPVPQEIASHIKETFIDLAETEGLDLDEIPKLSDIAQVAPIGVPFFYVELPRKEKLYHRIKKNFPLQFGRQVLASPPLLDIPERVDWRECEMTKEEEIDTKKIIQKLFSPFDFTLEDSDDDED
ncbi:CWF19-like protein 1 [Oratosquilla oratoria]|uniref:CWF19-like protein 1 n=1 Tax=Oratosquilla oratoria TaxID=337810 RepID=UPI003F7691F4